MVYLITSLIYFLNHKFSIHSVSALLFFLLIFSTVAAILTGRLLDLPNTYFFYEIYIAVMLYILFSSWSGYYGIKDFDFSDIDERRLNKVERITVWINSFVFIVDIIVFATVFALLVAGVIHVSEYKNGGDSDLRNSIISNLVPSIFMTLSYILSPLGYLSLALHFYYLIKGNIKKSVLHLILSLTIVLIGVIGLSRSALVNYVFVYAIMFLFLVPLLNRKLFKKTVLAILLFGGGIGFVFSTISEDRFGESFYIDSKSLIDENEYPELVSFLDYFSQWEYFGPVLMEKYNPKDLSWGLYNSCGIAVAIQQQVYGAEKINNERNKKYDRIIGDLRSAFHGCVVRCIFDFGYLGTFLFIILNSFFTRKVGPNKNRAVRFKTLMAMPFLLLFSLGFFSGNSYSDLSANLAMIYMWVIYRYCRTVGLKRSYPTAVCSVN